MGHGQGGHRGQDRAQQVSWGLGAGHHRVEGWGERLGPQNMGLGRIALDVGRHTKTTCRDPPRSRAAYPRNCMDLKGRCRVQKTGNHPCPQVRWQGRVAWADFKAEGHPSPEVQHLDRASGPQPSPLAPWAHTAHCPLSCLTSQ